jgi:hypothetical protein
MTSALNRPLIGPAKALSSLSPTPPTEGSMPASPSLSVLPFQRLHLFSHVSRDPDTLAAGDLGLLDPPVQGLGRTTDLRGNRHGRLPA